jgi:hypothetical protein
MKNRNPKTNKNRTQSHTLKKPRQKREKLRKSGEAYSIAAAETSGDGGELGKEVQTVLESGGETRGRGWASWASSGLD